MNFRTALSALRPALAAAAQAVIDGWEQDDEGIDEELGEGGVCDRVATAMAGVIDRSFRGVEIHDGGQDGDDHAYIIVDDGREAFAVDIPPGVYETGSGYRWRKRKGAVVRASDVVIEPVDRRDL